MTKRVPKAEQTDLAGWLKELREKAGLSQAAVAAASGLSERQVIRWEKEGNGSALNFIRWLEACGVTLVPAPPLAQRMDAAADRIEQAIGLLEQAVSGGDGSLAKSRQPHGEG